jgi:hypothetical protein
MGEELGKSSDAALVTGTTSVLIIIIMILGLLEFRILTVRHSRHTKSKNQL